MNRLLALACIFIGLSMPLLAHAQKVTPNKLYKFRVKENGIYKIGYNELRAAGLNPDELSTAEFGILTFPTGMLPQPNSASRVEWLKQVPVKIIGGDDGKFDRDDLIVFYGQGPDKYSYNASKQIFAYENNLYSDVNYYYLTVNSGSTKVSKGTMQPGGRNVVNSFFDLGYYENDQYNDLKSGRDWFGEQFDTKNEVTVRFDMANVVPNSTIRFVSNLMAQTYFPANFKIFWNNTQILDRTMEVIPESTYGDKGKLSVDTLTFTAGTVSAGPGSTQDIKIVYTRGSGNRSVGYLNYMLFSIARRITMSTNPSFFTVATPNAESDIEITSFKSGSTVWDITDPFNVTELPVTATGDVAKVASFTTEPKQFVAFSTEGLKTPEFVSELVSPGLHQLSTPSLLIVTHPAFEASAQRLAAHRRSAYGIDVAVVTTEQIYTDFSGGRMDVTAIRDFARYLYLKQPGKLQNLLLFGRGSYDYKDRIFNNTNFVPIYQSRNSLSPLETYSSDDYYGFFDEDEGFWHEPKIGDTDLGDHTLEIGVGRLPATSVVQADILVDKLIAYDSDPDPSTWKQRVLFVADDGDWNAHQSDAESMAENFEILYKGYHTSKLYLDAFKQESFAAGQQSPEAKEALRKELDKGYSIINYTGHGSERVWMQERILDQDTPLKMRNGKRQPIFITATCEFGRHDDPLLPSTAEMLLMKKDAGAIALVTTSRPVSNISNSILNRALYASALGTAAQKDLGKIFRETKNNSISGVANRNFSLLGDPSMLFYRPQKSVVVTGISVDDGSDVLKALSKVTVLGEVRIGSTLSSSFNGTIDVELFDRRTTHETLGDESAPFAYKLWDHSLFRGKGRIVNGEFAVEFILPKGVSEQVNQGKIIMYATNASVKNDHAAGTLQNVKVGGINPNAPADVKGPDIELFMGDTTFVAGGYSNSDTHLVGKLSDKSGINISGYADGNLVATLDGKTTFNVNDYFVASEDDFTKGVFSYPINDLEEGHHTITFKALDTYGNPGTASIEFTVGADGDLVVEDLYGWPNPFSEAAPTNLEFRHNRSGEDLEVQVAIYDVLGNLADTREYFVPDSRYKVTLFDWNGIGPSGTKMRNGLYVVKLVIRSVSDGAKNAKIAKLILSN